MNLEYSEFASTINTLYPPTPRDRPRTRSYIWIPIDWVFLVLQGNILKAHWLTWLVSMGYIKTGTMVKWHTFWWLMASLNYEFAVYVAKLQQVRQVGNPDYDTFSWFDLNSPVPIVHIELELRYVIRLVSDSIVLNTAYRDFDVLQEQYAKGTQRDIWGDYGNYLQKTLDSFINAERERRERDERDQSTTEDISGSGPTTNHAGTVHTSTAPSNRRKMRVRFAH